MNQSLFDLVRGLGAAAHPLESIARDRSDQTGLELLRRINRELKLRIDGAADRATPDRVFAALHRFRTGWTFQSAKDARLVCAQIHLPSLGSKDAPLRPIEDDTWYGQVIDNVERLKKQPRLFRRCYRGLLTGYFECDPEDGGLRASGRANWEQLRDYLSHRVPLLRVGDTDPAWVGVLSEHRNLLGDAPCDRYAEAVLGGDDSEWRMVRETFGLTGAMWPVRRLVEAQVDAATDAGDAEFVALIPAVLETLGQFESLLDDGLAKLLNRYRTVRPAAIHAPLRDLSTARWHSPLLAANNGNWSRVAPATRDMVADWIKLETIQQFFEFLADEGPTDKRRVRYWEKRYKQIDQFWLALGDRAMYSADPDFKNLRSRMKRDGLVKELRNDDSNNAIIMSIGDLVVVEFSKTGNACFAYHRSLRLPFDLDAADYFTRQLKQRGAAGRLTHMHEWERRFDQFMKHHGIPVPSVARPPARGRS